MARDASTLSASSEGPFSLDFLANLPSIRRAIRGQPTAKWARQRGLEEDLVQLALMDLARVESRFDAGRASSRQHFRMAVLPTRVSDCVAALKRQHSDFVSLDEDRAGDERSDEDAEPIDFEEDAVLLGDQVTQTAMRRQLASTLIAAIEDLPATQRRVMELALTDCSDREIADKLRVSVQAVNKSRRAAIAKLRGVVLAKFPNH